MTLRTSLFNLGIYKNTLRRFKWGSFLYFVILFFAVPFIFLTQSPSDLYLSYKHTIRSCPLILTETYMIIPLLTAFVVPTVTAALAYGNVHSVKQGIFVHSLPVTRGANYISTLAACLTLMALPVLLTAIILLAMSITAYSAVITAASVVYWLAFNIAVLFIMFSIATFSAMLTGNTAAHFVINIFIHLVPVLCALAIYLISDIFLFGFYESENFIANKILLNHPVVWLCERVAMYRNEPINVFTLPKMWIFIAGAAAIYILGYLLYRRRKIEMCGDVAAFEVFKPILKYSVAAGVAIATFGVLSYADIGAFAIFAVATVLTLIAYFAAEMLLSKSFKVFGKYKGYIVFWCACALFIAFFAYTDVFGYESRIPNISKIESASVWQGYNRAGEPFLSDEDGIRAVTEFHSDCIKERSITEAPRYYSMRISYVLKNGKKVDRRYYVDEEAYEAAMKAMYAFSDYKMRITGLSNVNIDNVKNIDLQITASNFRYEIALNEKSSELLYALKKDIEELPFEAFDENNGGAPARISVYLGKNWKENEKEQVFKPEVYSDEPFDEEMASFLQTINGNFKHTMAFLKENGYYNELVSKVADNLVMCTVPMFYDEKTATVAYKNDTGDIGRFMVSVDDTVSVSGNAAYETAIELTEGNAPGLSGGKNYLLFCMRQDERRTYYMSDACGIYSADNLPQRLKGYVKE